MTSSRLYASTLVALGVLSACLAAPLVTNETGCCFPEQFEADVFVELEVSTPLKKPDIRVMMFAGSFDYKNDRAVLISDDISVFYMFGKNNSAVYSAYDGGKKCIKSTLPFHLNGTARCITKEMNFVSSTYFGSPAKPLNVTTFVSDAILGDGSSMSVTVTSNGCYPVSDVLIGKKHDLGPIKFNSLFEVVSYVNTYDGIIDLDVFKLPDSCQNL